MANQGLRCLAKELGQLKSSTDLSVAVAFNDDDIRHIKALIVGPPDTPYEFGFFEFDIEVPSDYPANPPRVTALTTEGGRVRFNPNIYASGYICLSILGTWRGEPGEQWSPAQGIESVLISIQSLMSANPYENEPGYEDLVGHEGHKSKAEEYKCKLHHETIRISVLQRLEEHFSIRTSEVRHEQEGKKRKLLTVFTKKEPRTGKGQTEDAGDANQGADESWQPFADLCKRRFLWYYHSYQGGIDQMMKKGSAVKDGRKFKETAFEGPGNRIEGKFNYSELKVRLEAVRAAINKETETWISKGMMLHQQESPISLAFENIFKAIAAEFKGRSTLVELELIKGNPFQWRISLFGRPMTNIEGGIFNMQMVISKLFPEEQPRVKVETPLFHHRVSPDGILCYVAERPNDLLSHIEAIIHAIEDEATGFNPMEKVNPEASRLLLEGDESRKMYHRRVRRSAQASTEE